MVQHGLVTKAEWDGYHPYNQGYLVYWQGAQPGSELKNLTCPYPEGSVEFEDYMRGERQAVLNAQDSEE